MNFQCNWDTSVISITIVSILIILGIIIMLIVKMRYYKRENMKIPVVFTGIGILFFLSVLIVSTFFAPLNVSVKNDSIHIHRLKGDIVIPGEKIIEIRLCNDLDTKNSVRTFGSGGYFGYLGKFRSPQLGNYQMYVTDNSKKMLIRTNNENIIFSCDRPDELLGIVNTIR